MKSLVKHNMLKLRERNRLENTRANGILILTRFLKKWDGRNGVDHLAKDKARKLSMVNTVTTFN